MTVVGIAATKQNFNIAALYCPPKHNLKKEAYLDYLTHLKDRFILGGDFNAKHIDWGSRLTTTKGRELREAIRNRGCTFHSTGKPTYWPTDPNKVPDLLDFFIARKVSSNFIDIEENFDLNSDHSAVILTLSERIIKKENSPTLVNKSTDWESFKLELENKIDLKINLQTKIQLDIELEKFVKNIQDAAWSNTKEYTHRTAGNNYPIEIRNLVKEKRKARRKWQQSRDPYDKNILNRKTQELKREINKLKEESINSFLHNLTPDETSNYSLWRATRKIKRPVMHIPPIRMEDGRWARENKQKAVEFAKHLESTFTPHNTDVNNFLDDQQIQEDQDIPLVTPKEISEEISLNLNPKKY